MSGKFQSIKYVYENTPPKDHERISNEIKDLFRNKNQINMKFTKEQINGMSDGVKQYFAKRGDIFIMPKPRPNEELLQMLEEELNNAADMECALMAIWDLLGDDPTALPNDPVEAERIAATKEWQIANIIENACFK